MKSFIRRYCYYSVNYNRSRFKIKTFNTISPVGLSRFDPDYYHVSQQEHEPDALILRSHNLINQDIPSSVKAIGRCGVGVDNISVNEMTKRGIPVFNTPGTNSNSVKELVICSLMLASRGIVQGLNYTSELSSVHDNDYEKVTVAIEKSKNKFKGQEIRGKTLGIIGMGSIGKIVAETASILGMRVLGYDKFQRVFPRGVESFPSLKQLLPQCDYLSLHLPYNQYTRNTIGLQEIKLLKPDCHILNFSRGGLVDTQCLRTFLDQKNHRGMYISDFSEPHTANHPFMMTLPHLGASTAEAEDTAAIKAVEQIKNYLERGIIKNSVNFPDTVVPNYGMNRWVLIYEMKKGNDTINEITNFIKYILPCNFQKLHTVCHNSIIYTLVDLKTLPPLETQELLTLKLGEIPGFKSSRFI